MKKHHYSVLFADTKIKHHGEFFTSFIEVADIVKKAKHELSIKIKEWNKKPEDVVFFEIYYNELMPTRYDAKGVQIKNKECGKEINVFKWEK